MVEFIEENPTQERFDNRKKYSKPEVIHELDLETRAGSPLGNSPNLFDPTGLSDNFE